eukprot:m.52355 g.52355  ORF g.52355 m.52355 type:complete len:259 (+) comp13065_c0_seq2:500-1276(+)
MSRFSFRKSFVSLSLLHTRASATTLPVPSTAPVPSYPHACLSSPAMGPKIAIIYYSMYGHIREMAHKVAEGARSVAGASVDIFQVPETLPKEVLEKMHAADKGSDPVFTHDMMSTLPSYDGILFGIPTRYGMMSAQMKAFFDGTGGLWTSGALVGKYAGIFVSTGTMQGGQETTALTTVTQLAHHGMIFVPCGYSFGAKMFDVSTVHGGTPYGASTFAGPDGSRRPSEVELEYAAHQGKHFTNIVKKATGHAADISTI